MFPQFFELHGRYGPEGPLQLYVQGGYCWLLRTSRCIPFPGWQAPIARHSCRYGPEVQLQWHVQSWFLWCFSTSCCVARGVQENWILGDGAYFSPAPCIWKSLVRAVCLRSTVCLFPVDDFRNFLPYSALFLVQQRIRIRHQSRGFLEEFHAFLCEGRTFGSCG